MHEYVQTTLQQSGVAYQLIRHQDLQAKLGREIRSPADFAAAMACDIGSIVKTLLIRGRSPEKLALVSLPAISRLDMSAVALQLGCSRVEMADADVLVAELGYPRNGVSPIAAVVDGARLPLLIDTSVLAKTTVFVGTGEAGEELALAPQDLLRMCPDAVTTSVVDRQ